MDLWTYPSDRYYYGWYGAPLDSEPTDGEIKAAVVERLRDDQHTKPFDLKVDVKQHVVVLGGQVSTPLAKRVAGDDAWDTRGVVDVSNQIEVARAA